MRVKGEDKHEQQEKKEAEEEEKEEGVEQREGQELKPRMWRKDETVEGRS